MAAPAGYGKTTLLAEWARSSRFPVAWLSLDKEENDLDRFLRYLLAAWEEVQPGVQESRLGLLLSAMAPDSEAVLSAFVNAGSEVPNHVVFVLDDYHLIEDPPIHDALTFLLDHLPPTLHFVLAGRAEPPLPLARYRARQQLYELRPDDLRFSQEETLDFLNRFVSRSLSPGDVALLHAETEGWIAGLQLVALTSHHHRDQGRSRPVVSGRHPFIADYLAQDVLDHLPPDVRDFLLKTGMLELLSGHLCEAVTGREGGQEMLELLERENLFIVPLDDRREWYRYHRLFADFLYEELRRRLPDEVAPLHRAAARWYLAHDLPEQAFHHAVEGNDVDLVVQIVDRYVLVKLFSGEIRLVQRWLESLPESWYTSHPVLGLAQAGGLFFAGQFDACVRCLDRVERLALAESAGGHGALARVTAIRCFVACFHQDLAQAEALAEQALRELPAEDLDFRVGVHASLGDTYRQCGRWKEAKACYLKVLDFPHAPTFRIYSVQTFGALADLELQQGRLHDSAAYWSKALAVIQERETWGAFPLPVIGWVFIRMGEILYEWNELEQAGDHLARGLKRAELGGDVRALIAGYLLAGRLRLAEGDIAAAAEYLERVRPLVEAAPFPEWTGRFERFQLEFWLAQDRLRAAVHWADQVLPAGEPEGRPESDVAQLAIARVLIVKGDAPSLERALSLLDRLLEAAEAEGRKGVLIEALALQALGRWRRDEGAAAVTSLERALRLAEPEGYVRLFADLGLPMARLLHEARARAVLPDYVAMLLAAFGGGLSFPPPAQETLPEPLTSREQEVLELIAAGLTNREIGEALVISPETVKKHTGNIYSKLAVRSRREAVARARELALLL